MKRLTQVWFFLSWAAGNPLCQAPRPEGLAHLVDEGAHIAGARTRDAREGKPFPGTGVAGGARAHDPSQTPTRLRPPGTGTRKAGEIGLPVRVSRRDTGFLQA
ncbi:hypothetical protein GCM10025880_43150 [Methylorubrum aminovorans]|nr:hypothetical protein GCM10025880_43150 [Methylorubrum aminovorans]